MQARVQELLDTFAVPGANAAELLSDRQPAGATALTVIAANQGFADISYGELREKSTQFAAALSSLGVRRGDHVATLMTHSLEMLIALLGIWRLGAVELPLSTSLTHHGIDARLPAISARIVMCDAEQRSKLVPPGDVPTDASRLVIVARGEAYGYDVSLAEMLAGTGPFGDLEPPRP
ncbi:AMP-binding protein [Arthrobacter sp. HLT1-20]